jgi:succinoglycan biosynthesis transport protein ExoP
MNKPDRALTVANPDDRLLELLTDRLSSRIYADYEVIDDTSSDLDVRAIWSAVYRNRWLIAAVVGMSLALGVAATLLMTPKYRASATVQVEQQSTKVLGTEETEPALSAQEADRFLQTQLGVIKSRTLALRVATALRLNGNRNFLKAMGTNPLPGDASPAQVKEQTLSTLEDNLYLTLPRNSRIIQISFDSRNPFLAADVANQFADNYIVSNLQRKFDTSSYSRDFLQKQLGVTKAKLENSERALIAYSRAAGLIDASAGASTDPNSTVVGPRSLTTSNLVQFNQAFSQAKSDRVAKQQRWDQARVTPLMNLSEVLANPTIQQLTQKRAEAQALYEQDLARWKQGHPSVIQAKANIDELDREIATLATSIRNSIRDQYLVAARQERALQGNVGQLKGETLAEQDRGVRYNILKREVDTNRELYDGLLQRYKQVGAEAGLTLNNISVVDRADPPLEPFSPRPLINLLFAAIVGVVLASLLVFVRERFDDAIRVPEDVDQKLRVPMLGAIPMVRQNGLANAITDPASAYTEAHQMVRSSIELSSNAGMPRTLLLTSSRPGEGKSTTAYALARDLALAGQRVLLIDADMRKPCLHLLLSLPNSVGLSNLLARQKSLNEVMQNSSVPGLHFIGSGPLPPSAAQLLATNLFSDLLADLTDTFDTVIVDGPPVLGLADATRLASSVEGVVFIVEASGAHRGHAKSTIKRLLRAQARIVGAVLTKFDPKKSGLGEAYGYFNYDHYKAAPALAAAD